MTGEVIQKTVSNIGSKLTEEAKGLAETIDKGLQDLAKYISSCFFYELGFKFSFRNILYN